MPPAAPILNTPSATPAPDTPPTIPALDSPPTTPITDTPPDSTSNSSQSISPVRVIASVYRVFITILIITVGTIKLALKNNDKALDASDYVLGVVLAIVCVLCLL